MALVSWLKVQGGIDWQRYSLASQVVDTEELAGKSVTTLKINDLAVTNAKINDCAIDKLTAGSLIVAALLGTNGVIQSAALGARITMDSTGIKLYDATTQRGQILSDGSGWFGSATSLYWTTTGVLTVAGAYVSGALSAATISVGSLTAGTLVVGATLGTNGVIKSADSGARITLDLTGIKGYDATTQRFFIGSDGSGWFGASSITGIQWTTAGVLTMAAANVSGALTAATISASSITVGNLAVTMTITTGSLTVAPTATTSITIDSTGLTVARSDNGYTNNIILKYGAGIVGYLYPVSGGSALMGDDDLFIGNAATGGIDISAGTIGSSVTDNTLDLNAVDDILVTATDDLTMDGDEVSIRSGGNGGAADEDDIMIDSGDDAWIYADTSIYLKPAYVTAAGRTYIDKLAITNNVKTVGGGTPARAVDTEYQNTGNYPITVHVTGILAATTGSMIAYVKSTSPADVAMAQVDNNNAVADSRQMTFDVPIGHYYYIASVGTTLLFWVETTIGV